MRNNDGSSCDATTYEGMVVVNSRVLGQEQKALAKSVAPPEIEATAKARL